MKRSFLPVLDKFTGEEIGRVPVATEHQVRAAVARAAAAFPDWAATPAHRRATALAAAARGLAAARQELALLIAREAGKALKFALAEADRAVETFTFAAEEAKRIHGETIPMDASAFGVGRFGFSIRTPLGVIAAISPFNFPLNLVAHKVAPALAAGNAVVLKPASATPLTAFKLGEILLAAGLPDGVFNIVVGGGATVGRWLVADPRPAMVTFTGSPEVGEEITRLAGIKKVTLELGNNGGAIVEPDADLADAVGRCVTASFANSGQVCISLQRLYVHRSIAREFTRRFIAATRRLKVGNPTEPDTDVGPMISLAEAKRAEQWVRATVRQGARALVGGKRRGSVMEPTVLDRVTPGMRIICQEVFAPVVSIIPYRDFDDALAQLADSAYGLQAGVFTRDIGKILQAMRTVDVGGLMVNDTSMFRLDHMPYGGNRRSGIGREGIRYAIEEMTNLRMVVIRA